MLSPFRKRAQKSGSAKTHQGVEKTTLMPGNITMTAVMPEIPER